MDTRWKIILSTVVQIFQLAIAGCVLMLGFVVFIFTAPLFDLLGPVGQRSILPQGAFQVSYSFHHSLIKVMLQIIMTFFIFQNISVHAPGVRVR